MLDAGQQVMQAMAEFVEQGGDLIVGQQRRLAADWRGEVAHQVGHRGDQQLALGVAALVARAVHPGAAALVGAGVEIEEEAPDMLAVLLNLEQAYVRVPGVEVLQLANLDAVELLHDGEQAGEHLVHREPGAHFFLGNAVALLAQALAVVADVPALQIIQTLLGGESLELGEILLGERFAAYGQVA
ncbi:Uncharacterised protein [Ectopseudomonas oleovorans]|uniref:Uncharacterized protein n=1 Tax=Ectopseudomonas oleovorans TaxID=301 RepID=A0A379K059_ECTOL|nr:Uncharacterised protein [Pseudomonas oleovorans]